MAGNPGPGELTGPAALEWLSSGPAPAYVGGDSSAWLQAPDGSLWHRDAQGGHFALAADGRTRLPLSDEGLLYAPDGGGWRTSLADGTSLSLRDDGQLLNRRPDGTQQLLADDALFYLVAPTGALHPIAADGEILSDAGIGPDGGELVGWSPDFADGGYEARWTMAPSGSRDLPGIPHSRRVVRRARKVVDQWCD